MTKFNLSKKMFWDDVNNCYKLIGSDVKEFIKILEFNKVCSECHDNICNCGKADWVVGLQTIKDYAGDDLNG